MRRMLIGAAACLATAAAAGAQTIDASTDFEGLDSTDFVIGTTPNTAHFTGGRSMSAGILELYHSGLFSWMVFDDGQTGRIDFARPADIVRFWARDSIGGLGGVVTAVDTEGRTVETINLTTTYTQYTLTGLGPIAALTVVNADGNTGESSVIDDFEFGAVDPLDDPIPASIGLNPAKVDIELVAEGLTAPNTLVPDPTGGDRLFVIDQSGLIRIIDGGVLLPDPFLDVSSRLVTLGIFGSHDPGDYDERGLLGMAFHPDYAVSGAPGEGLLYTYTSEPVSGAADFTTADPPPAGAEFNHQSVITEWRVDPADPNRVDPASRREIMRVDEPQFNHNAGEIVFGQDGFMYVSFGDGGGADDEDGAVSGSGVPRFGHGVSGNGQNINTILGSIIRIDPLGTNSASGKYGVPASNPFVGVDGLDEIFAYGFRNPFRFSVHPDTGDLIVADVGQNDIEEVDVVTAGNNYGWRFKEGSFRFITAGPDAAGFVIDNLDNLPAGLVDPALEYDHDEGISVIGGFVYHGAEIPALSGKYIFGDFSSSFGTPDGRLFAGDLGTGQITELRLGGSRRALGLFLKGFGEDSAGNLYLLAGTNLGPYGTLGKVFRLVPACPCEYDGQAGIDVFDLLGYLGFWFNDDARAELTGDDPPNVDVFDLLEYLSCWFDAAGGAPCP